MTDGVWCFRRPSYFACSYVVADHSGVIAIDAGMDSHAGDFLEGMQAAGLSPDLLRAVLLTHWHNDHAAGAAFLKERFAARVYYHNSDIPWLTRRTATNSIRAWFGRHIPEEGVLVLLRGLLEDASPEAVEADCLVSDGEAIEGVFRVLTAPGHTPGHVAYFHEPTRALFCGDALAVVKHRIRLLARPVTPDLTEARRSAIKCLREEPDFLCPGHRRPLSQNVRQECRQLRAYLEGGGRWPLLG
ncbi:MAG TPA: MBL fold metallo-hydrolase [Bryobacteraceae bacterium]|nr:MBL fold metallo-hydrolase [Bryobacteraceae bacterium]